MCTSIINAWQQGRIPFFEKPPKTDPSAPLRTVEQICTELAPVDAEANRAALNADDDEDMPPVAASAK